MLRKDGTGVRLMLSERLFHPSLTCGVHAASTAASDDGRAAGRLHVLVPYTHVLSEQYSDPNGLASRDAPKVPRAAWSGLDAWDAGTTTEQTV